MKSNAPEFILVPLEGKPDDELDLVEVIGHVLINPIHLVSAQFNVTTGTLLVTTTTSIGSGGTTYQWEPEEKIVKRDNQFGKVKVPGKFQEKSYDNWGIEPASILVKDRKAIEKIWKVLYPSVEFTGFAEHEALINKISELKSAKQREIDEKAKAEALGLTKVDGSPLTSDTVEKPTILGADGEVANAE